MSKKKKAMSAKKRLVKDLRKLASLIERIDTPMKILHAHAARPSGARADGRA